MDDLGGTPVSGNAHFGIEDILRWSTSWTETSGIYLAISRSGCFCWFPDSGILHHIPLRFQDQEVQNMLDQVHYANPVWIMSRSIDATQIETQYVVQFRRTLYQLMWILCINMWARVKRWYVEILYSAAITFKHVWFPVGSDRGPWRAIPTWVVQTCCHGILHALTRGFGAKLLTPAASQPSRHTDTLSLQDILSLSIFLSLPFPRSLPLSRSDKGKAARSRSGDE